MALLEPKEKLLLRIVEFLSPVRTIIISQI